MSTTDRPSGPSGPGRRTADPADPGERHPRPGTARAQGALMGWRGLDFVTIAVLGVAFGVVFFAFDTFVYPGFEVLTAGFPPASSLSLGLWLLPAVVGGLLVRRPGAAFMCEMIAALLEMWLGNQWGAGVIVSGVLQGLGAELGFALFAFRRFGPVAAIASGLLSAVVPICLYEWWWAMAEYAWGWRFVALGFAVLSGVIVAGLGGWALVRALAGAGAINAFPAGREHILASARTRG